MTVQFKQIVRVLWNMNNEAFQLKFLTQPLIQFFQNKVCIDHMGNECVEIQTFVLCEIIKMKTSFPH